MKTLNTGGHSDWRLPNVNELKALYGLDFTTDPAARPSFYECVGGQLLVLYVLRTYLLRAGWPSATASVSVYSVKASFRYCLAGSGRAVWVIWQFGYLPAENRADDVLYSSGASILLSGTGQDGDIQAGVAWPSPRFVDHGDTVTDSLTGLEWTEMQCRRNDMAGALDFVQTLNTGGHSDWRLPNVKSLKVLPTMPDTIRPCRKAILSGTRGIPITGRLLPAQDSTGDAWYVDFNFGRQYTAPVRTSATAMFAPCAVQ